MKVAAHEAEEESDNIAEDFLEGKTDIDDFLSSFMEKKKKQQFTTVEKPKKRSFNK